MRLGKYLIYTIFIIFSFIILGELFVLNLDSFTNDYITCSFSVSQMGDTQKVKEDMQSTAKKYSIGIFTVDGKVIDDRRKEYHIYGNDVAIKHLKEERFVCQKFESIPAGQAEVYFHPWKEIPDRELLGRLYFTDLASRQSLLKQFKKELIDLYGGGFPKDYGQSHSLRDTQIFLFVLSFLILVLLTMYELNYRKKENYVKFLHGEDVLKLNCKCFLFDEFVIVIITFLLFFGLRCLYYLDFALYYLILFLFLQMGISFLLYFKASWFDIKVNPRKVDNKRQLIAMSYIIKMVCIFLLANLIYQNVFLMSIGLDYQHQKSFFETLNNHYYCQMNYKMDNTLGKDKKSFDDTALVHDDFNRRYYSDSLLMFNLSQAALEGVNIVLMNQYALKKQGIDLGIESIKDKQTDLVIFYPAHSDYQRSYLELILSTYYPKSIKLEEKAYEDTIKVIAINDAMSRYRSQILTNPIVICELNNVIVDAKQASARLYYAYHIPYGVSQEVFQDFIIEKSLEHQIVHYSNVFEYYQNELKHIRRNVLILMFVSLLFLFLNFVMLSVIIELYYTLNKKELVLKSVLGYSVVEKNVAIIIMQIVITLIALCSVYFVNYFVAGVENNIFILIVFILFIIECFALYFPIRKHEKILVSHIVKGGDN